MIPCNSNFWDGYSTVKFSYCCNPILEESKIVFECSMCVFPCDASLSYLTLEGPISNHVYWPTTGSIGLNGHSDKSSSLHLLLFPVLQHDSDSAHRFHSPSHSQLLGEPKPSCPLTCSAVWMTRKCSERHWTAQCGGASLKSFRFFSLSPGCVKVHLRPLWLPSSLVH